MENRTPKEKQKIRMASTMKYSSTSTLEARHAELGDRLKTQTHDLEERIKEISCLYGISRLVENCATPLEKLFQQIVDLIPGSWQYPEITCAGLVMESGKYRTANYLETPWKQAADVRVSGKKAGVLSVFYLEEKPQSHEGPFLAEERSLINAIAERLGCTTEQKESERDVYAKEAKLKQQNILLKEKNIALKEVMHQLVLEKEEIEVRVLNNVDQLLLPLLQNLRKEGSEIDNAYLGLLHETVATLTSSFGLEISNPQYKLTPRETEICNMIRIGLTSKQMASLLNISYRSVETYRNFIRKKLGIINTKTNLTAYLSEL